MWIEDQLMILNLGVNGVTVEQNNAVTDNVTDVTQSVTAPLLTGFIEDASVIKAVTKDKFTVMF